MTFDLHFYETRGGTPSVSARPLTARGLDFLHTRSPSVRSAPKLAYDAAIEAGLAVSFETVELRDKLAGRGV